MKLCFAIATLATVLVGIGCTPKPPQTQLRQPQSTLELLEGVPKVLAQVQDERHFNESTCARFINETAEYLYNLPSDYFFPKSEGERNELRKNVMSTYQNIFRIQTAMQKRWQNFENPSKECGAAVRRGLRFARFVGDMLTEWMMAEKMLKPNKTVLSEIGTQTVINPEFGKLELKTGDVILMRGQSIVSATIARIGNDDADFSHLGLVGEDAQGNQYMVEALIETGAIITPLAKWYQKESVGRAVVYRNHSSDLAKKAGRMMYDYVVDQTKKRGNIPYDHAMLVDAHDEVFCTEIIRIAYKLASDGKVKVPMYMTSFSELKDTKFFKGMGIKTDSSFAPTDIELDPRFTAVAEYRNVGNLRRLRLQDAIMTSIFSWMSEKNYELSGTTKSYLKSRLGKFLRQFGVAADKMQKHMPISTIETIMKIDDLSIALDQYITVKEKNYYTQTGHSMTFREVFDSLESFRQQDCAAFLKDNQDRREHFFSGTILPFPPRPGRFHRFINSQGKRCDQI